MQKIVNTTVAAVLVASLVFPLSASAKGGPGDHGRRAAKQQVAIAGKSAAKVSTDTASAKAARKAARRQAKTLAKQERVAAKQAREASRAAEASETTAAASESATPNVAPAFSRIMSNLEKSVSKVLSGTKSQLPPGLVRVWLKFASWLGVDPTTMPGADLVSPAPAAGETTSTVDASGTVAPMPTDAPSASLDGSTTSAP